MWANGKPEIWKYIPGYEGLYQVSNQGNVRSVDRIIKDTNRTRLYKGKPLKQFLDHKGYKVVTLSKQGSLKVIKVHRLVAMAFIPNPESYPEINHKDENKINNSVENLEWCTTQYNTSYGTRAARMVATKRAKNGKQ